MAIKFTDLPQLSGTPADTDIVAIVDVSEDVSKKITVADLVSATGLDAASVRTIVEGSDLDMGSNKVLFSNMYATEADLPDATSYHGMFAHVHATGAAYFAHGGSWVKLANFADMPSAVDTSAIEADIDALEAKVGSSDLTTPTTASSITYEEVLGAVHTVVSPSSDAITWRSSDNYNSVSSVGRYDGSNTRWQNEFDADRGFYATHDAIFISMEQSSKGVQRIVEYPLNATAIANDQPTAEYHGHTGESQGKYCTAMYADDDVVVATSQQGTGYLKIWTRGADGSNPINVTSPGSGTDWESWGKSVKRVNDYLVVGGYKVVSIHNMDGSFVQQLGPFGGVLPDANANAGGDHQGYGTSAIANYGNTLIIGAPNTDNARGRAMVFDLNDLGLPPTVLSSPEPRDNQAFGGAVDISADYVVVGGAQWYNGSSYDRGRVAVYDSSLNLLKTLAPTGSYLHSATKFGTAVAVRGTALLVGVRGPEPLGNGLRGAILQYDLTDLDAAPTIFVGPDADANFPRSMTTSPDRNVTQTVNSTIIPSADVSSAINYLEDKTNDMQASIAAAASSADIATAKSEAISTAAADATTKADQAEADAKAYADQVVAATIDAAPASLDTLNELAAALNDDANFASTVTASIATKADQVDLVAVQQSVSDLQTNSSSGGDLTTPFVSSEITYDENVGSQQYFASTYYNESTGASNQVVVYDSSDLSNSRVVTPTGPSHGSIGYIKISRTHLIATNSHSDDVCVFDLSSVFAGSTTPSYTMTFNSDLNGTYAADINGDYTYAYGPSSYYARMYRRSSTGSISQIQMGGGFSSKVKAIKTFNDLTYIVWTESDAPQATKVATYGSNGSSTGTYTLDQTGFVPVAGDREALAISNTILALRSNDRQSIKVWNMTNLLATPVTLSSSAPSGQYFRSVAASDDYFIAVHDTTGEISVYSTSNLSGTPTILTAPSYIDSGSHIKDIQVSGRKLFVGFNNPGVIYSYDLDDLSADPVIVTGGSSYMLGERLDVSVAENLVVTRTENIIPNSSVSASINYLEDKTNDMQTSIAAAPTSSDIATAKSEAISTAAADATAKADQAEADAKAYADQVVAATVDAAPAALDTLNELAAALGDDANFASTVTASIATKADASALAAKADQSALDTLDAFVTANSSDISTVKSFIGETNPKYFQTTHGLWDPLTAGLNPSSNFSSTKIYISATEESDSVSQNILQMIDNGLTQNVVHKIEFINNGHVITGYNSSNQIKSGYLISENNVAQDYPQFNSGMPAWLLFINTTGTDMINAPPVVDPVLPSFDINPTSATDSNYHSFDTIKMYGSTGALVVSYDFTHTRTSTMFDADGNVISGDFLPLSTQSTSVVGAINELHTEISNAPAGVTSADIATAKSEAISTASADATAKADQAEADAKAYADQVVAATIDAAPAALDTLNELAAALGDDANFASTVTASIATKADQSALDALETTVSGMDTSSIETDVSALESYIQAAGSAKMVVGVSQENKVLVYNTDGSLSHTIEAPTGALDFGKNIASNGSKIVVSAGGYDISPTSASAVYVFDMDGSNMVKIINSDAHAGDYFGKNDGAIAISDSKIVVGATTHNSLGGSDYADRTGAVYVYNLDGTGEVKILPSDIAKGEEFGNSVAISSSKVIVGSYKHATDGAVYVYNLDGTGELKLNSVAGGSSYAFGLRFGSSVAISETKMVVGSLYSGAAQNGSVHVYDIDGSNRVDIEPTGNLGATFGCDVALNSSKVVIGHKSANRAWIYDLDGSNGIEINTPANADQFGINVSATETKIVVGSKTADTGGVTNNGAAYIYDIDGTNELKVYDPTAGANAFFGEWSTIVEGAASYVTLQTTAQTVGEAINELHTEISSAPAGVTSADVATAKSEAISTAAAYADQVVAATVDAAPAALDTLNELAAALGDDANFASTVTASIATKADDAATTAALATKADQTELDTLETFVKGSGIDFFDHSDSQIANQWINVGGATASGSRLEWDVPNGTSSGSMFGNYVQNLLSATVNDYNSDNAFVIGDSYTLTLDVVSMPTDLKVTVMSAYQTSGASAVWVETTIPAGSTDSVSLEFTATDPGAYVILHGNSALGGVYHVENLAIMGDGEVPLATTATQVVPAINEVVSSVASLTSGTSSDIATAKSEAISTAAADATAKADQAEADAKAYADQVVAATVDAAPAALDTLNELAAALGDDANFASTVTASIAAKADAADLDALEATVGSVATSLLPSTISSTSNSVYVDYQVATNIGQSYTVSFNIDSVTGGGWGLRAWSTNTNVNSSDLIDKNYGSSAGGSDSVTFTATTATTTIRFWPESSTTNLTVSNVQMMVPAQTLDTTATTVFGAINELHTEISSSSSSIQTSSDVDAGDTAADGDVLVYDASSSHFGYVNLEGEVNSRVDAKIATTSVQGLSDVASSGEDTLAGGDFLLYDASTSKFGLVNFESEVQSYANAAANTAVANVVDAAPTSLDTLNELAAALGDDANFASTVTASIATKADDAATTAALATKATQSALDALSASMVSSASPTFTGSVSANNFVEGVSALSGTSASIDPSSGSLITHTLTGGTTYTYVEGWASGASVTLHIESAGNTVTWPSTKWVGGSAPDLSNTAGTHLINLWKVGSEVYGTYVGLAVSGPGAPTLILISAYREDSDTGAVYAFDHTDLSADPVQLQPTGTGAFFGSGVAATSPAHVVIGAWGDGTGGKVYVYDATDLSAAPTVLEPSDIGASDRFGISVAVSSNFIVVGSQLDDTNEGSNTGSVYVYNANDLSEAPTKLVPFALSASDYFGEKVACSDDYIAVSAPQDDDNGSASGSVFVWPASEMSSGNTIGGSATYTKLTPSDGASSDQFGTAIVISGTTLVVGSFHAASGMAGAGAAYVYDLTNLSTSPTKLMAESAGRTHYARFGGTLAMDGDTLVIGSWGQNVTGSDNTQGAAYVYDASNLGASPTKLIASDGAGGHRFGNTVAVKGNNIVIGASHIAVGATSSAGAAYVYDASDLSAAPVKIDAGTEAAQSAEFGNGIAIL